MSRVLVIIINEGQPDTRHDPESLMYVLESGAEGQRREAIRIDGKEKSWHDNKGREMPIEILGGPANVASESRYYY